MFKCRMKSLASNKKMCFLPKKTLEEFKKKGGVLGSMKVRAIGLVKKMFAKLGLNKIFGYLKDLAASFLKSIGDLFKKAFKQVTTWMMGGKMDAKGELGEGVNSEVGKLKGMAAKILGLFANEF